MNKPLSTESSLLVEQGLKVIDSLSKETTDITKDDSLEKLSESDIKIYQARLSIVSYFVYYKCTLEVNGAKTFYGHAGGLGSPGKGEFSGQFYFRADDISIIYQEARGFLAVTTPVSVSMAFVNSSLRKIAQFNGTGLGSISSTISGGGYWE